MACFQFGKTLKEGGGLLLIRVTNVLAGFLIVALFARLLGARAYGNYVLAQAICLNLTLALHLGMPTLLTREVAAAVATGNAGQVRRIERWSLRLILTMAAVLAVLASVALTTAAALGDWPRMPHFLPIALLGGGIVVTLALQQRSIGLLSGLGRVVAAQLPDGVIRPLALLALGVAALTLWPRNLAALLGGFLAASLVSLAAGWLLLRRARPDSAAAAAAPEPALAWLRRLAPFLAIGVVVTLNGTVDVLLLSAFLPPAEVGRYKVAALLAAIPLNLHTVSQNMLMPRAARAWAVGDLAQLARLARAASRVSFLVVFTYAALFAIGSEWVVDRVFGKDFAAIAELVFLLLASGLLATFAASGPTLLNMCGHAALNSRIAAMGLAVNVMGGLLLIPLLGPAGAAFASIGASAFAGFMSWRAVRIAIGVRCDVASGFRSPIVELESPATDIRYPAE
jgi:O-antigen/teichoic acid export membrane protein